jgi:hypothetical protein
MLVVDGLLAGIDLDLPVSDVLRMQGLIGEPTASLKFVQGYIFRSADTPAIARNCRHIVEGEEAEITHPPLGVSTKIRLSRFTRTQLCSRNN